jgi:uncharacterized Tic20 family protein
MSDTTPRPDETTSDPTPHTTSDAQPTEGVATPDDVAIQDPPAPAPAPEAVAPPAPADHPQPPPAAADYPPPPAAADYPPPPAAADYPPPPGQQVDQPQPAYAPVTQPMTPNDERTAGMAAHGVALAATVFSGGLLGFVAALVMYLVFRDRGPFVRHHTANALNVQIIVGIVMLVSIPLMFVLIGFVTFAAAWLFAVIVHIIGAVKANNGEWWTPPMTPTFVK